MKKKKKENFYINSFKELRANELVNGGLLTIETKKKKNRLAPHLHRFHDFPMREGTPHEQFSRKPNFTNEK